MSCLVRQFEGDGLSIVALAVVAERGFLVTEYLSADIVAMDVGDCHIWNRLIPQDQYR